MMLNEQMADGGLAIVRTHKRSELDEQYGNLVQIDKREWGSMGVAIYQLKDKGQADDR